MVKQAEVVLAIAFLNLRGLFPAQVCVSVGRERLCLC